MKSHRQLHQTLNMPAEGPFTTNTAPVVFQNLVRLEKAATVEQVEASVEFVLCRMRVHYRVAVTHYITPLDNLHDSIDYLAKSIPKTV